MGFLRRVGSLIHRLLRGEDVVLVSQGREVWDRQFASGTWGRLTQGEPHSAFLAGLIRDDALDSASYAVLDVGCGNGGLARLLEGISYHGLDLSETALRTARSLAPQATFTAAPADTPPPGLGPVNAIVFADVLNYFEPHIAASRYKGIAPDATVFISLYQSWRSWFIWRRIKKYFVIKDAYVLTRANGPSWDIATARFKPE